MAQSIAGIGQSEDVLVVSVGEARAAYERAREEAERATAAMLAAYASGRATERRDAGRTAREAYRAQHEALGELVAAGDIW